MGKFSVKINDEYLPNGVKIEAKSLSITEGQPGNPTVCEFSIIDNNLNGSPFIWQTMKGVKVQVFEDGILIFGGQIDVPKTRKINNHPIFGEKIVCIDWFGILQHRYINKSYPRQLISEIVKDFIDSFLYDDGFYYDSSSIQESTSLYASVNYIYTQSDNAFEEMAGLINWVYWIGPDKKVYFKEKTQNISTVQLIENQSNYLPPSLYVEEDPSEYMNKKILKDVHALTDELTEKASPTPDKDKSFHVSFPINSKPSIFLSLLENIEDPPESDRVDPTQIGIGGLDSGLTFYWNKDQSEITQDQDAEDIPNNKYVVVRYIGQYKIDIIEEDTASINARALIEGTSGKYESVETGNYIESISVAEDYANALLDRYSGNIPNKITFASYTMKIQNGFFIDVILPSFNINSLTSIGEGYMVMDKRSKDVGGNLILNTYVLVNGDAIGGWINYMKSRYQGEKDFTLREDAIVDVPLYQSEILEWAGTLTMKTFDCLFPDNALWPADNLYPGTLTSTVVEYD